MKYVVFFAPKGGVGSTTLAAHFAWNAARSGVPTVAVSIDETGHLLHLLAGYDVCDQRDMIWPVEDNLRVTFSPEEVPQIEGWEQVPALAVLDVKHGSNVTLSRRMDLWVIPVGNEQTLRNLVGGRFPPIEADRKQLLFNRLGRFNPALQHARDVAQDEQMELYGHSISEAASIRQAVEESRCVWDGPFKDSFTNRTLRAWANATLQTVMQGNP